MNSRDRNRINTLIRVDEFGKTNAADFPLSSIGAVQFARISGIIAQVQALSGKQTTSRDEARFMYNSKATARENLRAEMSDISQTAWSMVYQIPGIDLLFRMTRNKNDAELLATARAFFTNSDQYEAEMIAYGLPDDFRAGLNALIEAFEQSMSAPSAAIDSQVEATADIGELVREGMIALRILDGVVKNKYRNDTGKLAVWTSASHIERTATKPTPTVNKS